MRQRLLIICVLASVVANAQAPKASKAELGWAFLHPIAAFKIKKISKKCGQLETGNLNYELDRFPNGGKADAYRHVFYMAAYAQKIKIKKLRKLGEIHEKTNYRQFLQSRTEQGEMADSLSCVMDLKNNELGFQIGSANKKIALRDLRLLVLNDIKAGKAFIMKRDKSGTYLTCEGKQIDLGEFKGKWVVPKCLVASDTQ